MSEDEKLVDHAAFEAGVRAIMAYPRRDFRVVSGRSVDELEFHFERAMAASAAELVLKHTPSDRALSQYLAGRAVGQPFAKPLQPGPVEHYGAKAAQEIVRLLARRALVDAGYFREWEEDADLAAWLQAEAEFCAMDARFVPTHS